MKTGKVIWRGGTTLLGAPKTQTNGIVGSFDWLTSSAGKISMRSYLNQLEFLYNSSTWTQLLTGFQNRSNMQFTTWWDANEEIDKLLFCNGTNKVGEWSGALVKIASVTATTLTKQGYLASTYTFNASANTITDSNSGFVTAGFSVGEKITITGSQSNDGVYTVGVVTASTITVQEAGSITNESPLPYTASTIAFVNGGSSNDTITSTATAPTYTSSEIEFVLPNTGYGPNDAIVDLSSGFLTAFPALGVGGYITVTGGTNAGLTFQVKSVSAQVIVLNSVGALTAEISGTSITLTASAGFLTAFPGLSAGDFIKVSGGTNNGAVVQVTAVSVGTITLASIGVVTNEIAGTAITLTVVPVLQLETGGSWDAARALTTGQNYYTASTIALVNNSGGGTADTITDSANGFLNNGLYAGQTIIVQSGGAQTIVTLASITKGTLTLTQSGVLTNTSAGSSITLLQSRGFTINGQNYYYTGGETTGTMTGLVVSPVNNVTAGMLAIQTVRWNSPAFLTTYEIDNISQAQNYIFYGSDSSQLVRMSNSSNFCTNTTNSPREPGDGADFYLTGSSPVFAPTLSGSGTSGNPTGSMWISCGEDDWFEVVFTQTTTQETSGDETISVITESVTPTKLQTSPGEGAVGQGAIFRVRNGVSFLSYEKVIEQLLQLQVVPRPNAAPISDDIKDDLDSYDVTGAMGVYFERNLWITLPAEELVLVYNEQYGFWQPPQQGFFTRLAIITINGVDTICGHSGDCNETHTLDYFDGLEGNRRDGYNPSATTDYNGAPINHVAAFGYMNYGMRFWQKDFSRVAAELILGLSTTVSDEVVYDYQGARGLRNFNISAQDAALTFGISQSSSLGQNTFGYFPLGNYLGDGSNTVKTRIIWTTTSRAFFEMQRIFSSSAIDDYAEILAYGVNVEASDNEPVAIIR
jgi:hypothetical protein